MSSAGGMQTYPPHPHGLSSPGVVMLESNNNSQGKMTNEIG